MISLKEMSRKVQLPDADYVFDKVDKLPELLDNLTPKFNGKWLIILIEPTIKYVKDLLSLNTVPEWVDVIIYMAAKKIEVVCLDFPKLQPKRVSNKEAFEEAVKQTKNLISKSAAKLLYQALGSNPDELGKTLQKLDEECTTGEITLGQVQSTLHYTKVIYASEVVNSFLLGEAQCWTLYHKLIHNIGMEYAYNAMYKYVKNLLLEKQKYLCNQDFKNYKVKLINAPLICYTYFLFVNSKSYKQLPEIMYCIQNRSKEQVERILNDVN